MLKIFKFNKSLIFLFALFLASLPFRLYHFSYPLLDSFNFRQAQTATVALNFYKYGIDLFKTRLDILGVGPEKYLLLEFPVYQALVAVFYKIFSLNIIWGRVVSIFSGFTGAYFLFLITRLISRNTKIAFFAVSFFLFVPLNLFYHRSFMIDPAIIAFLLASVYFFLKYSLSGKLYYYLPSVVLLTLGFIQKGLYGPFWLIPLTVFRIRKKSLKSVLRPDFILFITIPLATLFFWQRYENMFNTVHGHPFFTSYNPEHLLWNFGNMADRSNFSFWHFRLKQILNSTMLKPGLILFVFGVFSLRKLDKYLFFYSFLISQIIYFTVLFRIQNQNYYQLVIIPAVSIFMAAGLQFFSGKIYSLPLRALLVSLFFVFYIAKSWQNTLPSFYIDRQWHNTLTGIGRILPENSHGVFATADNDWNSVYSYYTGKKLLATSVEQISPDLIKSWQESGYSFLIIYDLNKSLTRLKQLLIPRQLEFMENYPVIYDSNNIIIYRI